jgi:hypothetical protein
MTSVMRFIKKLLPALIFIFSLVTTAQAQDSIVLSSKIDADQVSVSGVSSGAYMAVQLHVAYSDLFMGVGSIAGGPYYCSEDRSPSQIQDIKFTCMMGLGVDLTAHTYIEKAKEFAKAGKISNLDNLKDDRIYLFNAQADQVINPTLGFISRLFYNDFVDDPSSQIEAWAFIPKFGPFYPVAHGMPTSNKIFSAYQGFSNWFTPCSPSNTQEYSWFPNQFLRGNDPWMYNCDSFFMGSYDLAADVLAHIYGELKNSQKSDLNRLYAFKQIDYIDDPAITNDEQLNQHGLATDGYVYVPQNCQDGTKSCRLHVALHGCQMFPKWTFVGKAGTPFSGETITFGGLYRENVYNDIAEANDIVVLYPQAHNIGEEEADVNPYGCWEFWPFFDDNIADYSNREGPEMKFIANIVTTLIAGNLKIQP